MLSHNAIYQLCWHYSFNSPICKSLKSFLFPFKANGRKHFSTQKKQYILCVRKNTIICFPKSTILQWPHSGGMTRRKHLHFKLHFILGKRSTNTSNCHSCDTHFICKRKSWCFKVWHGKISSIYTTEAIGIHKVRN